MKFFSNYSTPILCPSCYQIALITDDGSKCLFCGYSDEAYEVAERYIENVLQVSKYEAITQGGEYPQYDCPECGESAFVQNLEDDFWKCFGCGYEGDPQTIHFCDTCGTPYSTRENGDIGMCNSCIEYRLRD